MGPAGIPGGALFLAGIQLLFGWDCWAKLSRAPTMNHRTSRIYRAAEVKSIARERWVRFRGTDAALRISRPVIGAHWRWPLWANRYAAEIDSAQARDVWSSFHYFEERS